MSLGIAGLLQNRQIIHVNGNKCTMQQLPFHALNAMGYFTASVSKLDAAMHIFFSKSPLKPTAVFKKKF